MIGLRVSVHRHPFTVVRKNLKSIFLAAAVILTAVLALGDCECVMAQQKIPVFYTWEGFEADKCASIWLIKRFISKNAVFKFCPKGETLTEGIPFDTPDAKFRRYHNMSAFESFLKHYEVHEPALVYIGKIIHDIEVNKWEQKVMPESVRVQNEINRIILKHENAGEVIEKSCVFFDSLHREVAVRLQRSHPAKKSRSFKSSPD
ncbi:MAG: chromate resistance protein ChrB domain-containing protein [Pseudomonadota bacterium]